jgi:methylated-DNA-[protein]-cysteine S-methyltransferase
MATSDTTDRLAVFSSPLGWMALVGRGDVLTRLTFGHASRKEAVEAVGPYVPQTLRPGPWNQPLVDRLVAYLEGQPDDFQDIPVDPGPLTGFQAKVVRCCRRIPFGSTLTYGQLAAKAGSPGAARAVGNCMARNPIPLVIPCHRVVASTGDLGGYSAQGGVAIKARLLAIEGTRQPGRVSLPHNNPRGVRS